MCNHDPFNLLLQFVSGIWTDKDCKEMWTGVLEVSTSMQVRNHLRMWSQRWVSEIKLKDLTGAS
jgi:hypothetical protein